MLKHFLRIWKDERAFAVVTHGSSLPDNSQRTDFYGIVDNATVTSIVAADISASAAIMDTQLNTISTAGKVNTTALTGQVANANLAQLTSAALVSGAALTLLTNIPSGAGIIPATSIGGILGAWTAKSVAQIYQATTDGFVAAWANNTTVTFTSDSSSTPSTVRQVNSSGSSPGPGIGCFVRKNDYYEVTIGTGSIGAIFFLPMGS